MEAMSEHPRVTYEEGKKSVSVDTSRVIFVLVSDVGAERLDAVVRSFKSRSEVVVVVVVAVVVTVVLPFPPRSHTSMLQR